MLVEVSAALNSLKAAKDIIQGLDSLRTEAAIIEMKVELQGLILDAQQGLFAAQENQTATKERVRELEGEIQRLADWSTERQRYAMRKFYPGTLVYALLPEKADGEPLHMLCKPCYDVSRKSALQNTGRVELRYAIFRCHTCKSEFSLGGPMSEESDKRLTSSPE